MIPLTPHEVEQLVSLRLSLEDALAQANGATKYRRGAAIVALDATVERASSLVAITRGVTVPTNGKLDDLISRLMQDLGPKWRPAILPDIRHLRRARNASQHEGLEPDREQVPVWASAANAYVASLIDAHFSVDIRRVVLSAAIRNADLRQRVSEAEAARDAGENGSCVDKAKEAYQEALGRWNRLRGGRRHAFVPMQGEILDKKGFDFLHGQLGNMQGVLEAAAFSQDLAEAEWFTLAITEQSEVLSADDAERVLTFAFEWIVEYERAADTWTPDRRHRAAVARRKIGSGNGPARIDECTLVDLQHGQIRAVFRIADVPDENDYQLWAKTLRAILPAHDLKQWWTVLDDGTVDVRKAVEAHTELSRDVELLSSALNEASAVMRAELDATREKDLVAQKKRDDYAVSIRTIRDDVPPWIEDIQWSDGWIGGGTTEQLIMTLDKQVTRLRFGERTPNSMFDDRKTIREVILDHEIIEQCYWTSGPNGLGILPVLDPEQLTGLFRDLGVVVGEQLEIAKRKESDQAAAILAAKVGIAAKLAELT